MGRWTALLERAAVEGSTLIERAVRTADAASNRWAVNYQGCEFGADWLLRAAVAHAAIYVNPVAEALYCVAELDSDGRPLTGRRRYEVCFPPSGLPPAAYFWSVTMYHDRGFLVDNPIDRFAIGDRTPGLRFEEGLANPASVTLRAAGGCRELAAGSCWEVPADASPLRPHARVS